MKKNIKKNEGWVKNKKFQPLIKMAWLLAIEIEPAAILNERRFDSRTVNKVKNTMHALGVLPNPTGIDAIINDITTGMWGSYLKSPELVSEVEKLRTKYKKYALNKFK